MSYSIFVQRFTHGEPGPLNRDLVQEVLQPYIVAGDRESFMIRAADGSEADIYGDATGLMIDRPELGGIFDIVAELASRLDAVLIMPGCPTLMQSEGNRAHLPDEFREQAIVVELSGAAIQRVLKSS